MTGIGTLEKSYTLVSNGILNSYASINIPFQPNLPKLLAVSKGQPFEKIEALYTIGHRDFGENYAQELVEKANLAKLKGLNEVRWHFIGKFQSNKLGLIQPICNYVHSVESTSHLDLFYKKSPNTKLFLSVNIDGEITKSGFNPAELLKADDRFIRPEVKGLMCIPDPLGNFRDSFIRLRKLADRVFVGRSYELSMGMSSDYTVAIEEGSSWVRVGSALFGERDRLKK